MLLKCIISRNIWRFYFIYSEGSLENEVEVDEEVCKFMSTINPGTVLQFATGANHIPVCGLTAKVTFTHDSEGRYHSALTCDKQLRLVVNNNTLKFEEFAKIMTTSLMCGEKFSTV